MIVKRANSYPVTIFIAGDLATAKSAAREWTFTEGACVTVEPVSYIYTGGQEEGVRVGFINYPRFPSEPDVIKNKAQRLAIFLMERLYQNSFSIETPEETIWFSRREEGCK